MRSTCFAWCPRAAGATVQGHVRHDHRAHRRHGPPRGGAGEEHQRADGDDTGSGDDDGGAAGGRRNRRCRCSWRQQVTGAPGVGRRGVAMTMTGVGGVVCKRWWCGWTAAAAAYHWRAYAAASGLRATGCALHAWAPLRRRDDDDGAAAAAGRSDGLARQPRSAAQRASLRRCALLVGVAGVKTLRLAAARAGLVSSASLPQGAAVGGHVRARWPAARLAGGPAWWM